MATAPVITGAPMRAPSEYLKDASCWLEQAAGIADLIAQLDQGNGAVARSAYGIRSLVEFARDAIENANTWEGR